MSVIRQVGVDFLLKEDVSQTSPGFLTKLQKSEGQYLYLQQFAPLRDPLVALWCLPGTLLLQQQQG